MISGDVTDHIVLWEDSNGNGGELEMIVGDDVNSGVVMEVPHLITLIVDPDAVQGAVGTFAGVLDLPNGLETGGFVHIGDLTGAIDFQGQPLAGSLLIVAASSGNLNDGGSLTGDLILGNPISTAFSGDVYIDDISEDGGLTGGRLTGGTITIGGDMDGLMIIGVGSGGSITITDDIGGRIHATGDMDGTIDAGDMLEDSRIVIFGSLLDNSGDEIEVDSMHATAAIAVNYDGAGDSDEWESGATIVVDATSYDEQDAEDRVWEVSPFKGDMNNDHLISNFDIDPFISAVNDPIVLEEYTELFPGLDGSARYHGDLDCSSTLNNFDIDPFVARVIEACETSSCGECPSFAPPEMPSPQAMAAILLEYVDSGRIQALIAIIDQALAGYEGDQYDYWSAVLTALLE